ncbi:uncharacterized protein LOC124336396 [Daphnia pulicaria]|uniref:uncharacterized protein LOC124336396 n=1 Tax=Daphnia pulicaria TaxID=35523 RepID=UPI001EEAC03C|nr:uncharacterized protein LOC124336396 [Daphnia pulicaria]
MTLFLSFCVLTLSSLLSSIHCNVLVPRGLEACGGSLYVEDAVVIDVPTQENCIWKVQTDKDHILVFSLADGGNFERIYDFTTIHDGLEGDAPALLLENQIHHEVGLTRAGILNSVYTTSSEAAVRFKNAPTSTFKLRIQKAVNCPFNVGSESQCGRIVDDTSCYCATFTKRSQASQSSFCIANQMKLLAIESLVEELAVHSIWPTTYFWTSGTDIATEGIWVWESTGVNLYPGYANWGTSEPDTLDGEDCILIHSTVGWQDYGCGSVQDGVCEAR